VNQPQRLGGSELERTNAAAQRAIGAGIEVHRVFGPGLMEPIYGTALAIELEERRIPFRREVPIPARYKGRAVGTYFADFIIDDRVILEIKCVTTVLPLFSSQMITYLRLSGKRLGLILNSEPRC